MIITFHPSVPFCQDLFLVASQQGICLAQGFNRMEELEENPEDPFKFKGVMASNLLGLWYSNAGSEVSF
ncbi:hypothetical protein DEO72_LG8g1176 [Vigna unguiculata]|uniref:Uncharacterized protein n=1 Tax=Vigna unguiculata TaxID=3917 RepID=A0A4D6MQY8_VIGUN|nr:hypothetical protein DEO72_LG8g1176 [Vigna unguiculata]